MKADWKAGQIGDVCTVIAGQSPKGSAYNDHGVGLPFYQGKKEFCDRHIGPPTTWTSVITKEGEPGDILMSVRAPVGPINEATQRICIGRGLAAIRAKDGLNRDFLWYALLWLQPTIKGSAGAVFDSINKAGIESLPIPLPPLEEQQRIVAVLDEAFEGLARARAHAEANLQNARDLFASFLENIGDERAPLGGYVAISTGKLNANAAVDGGEYPFFTCSREVFQIDNFAFNCEAILLAGNNASGDFNVKHYNGKFNAYQRTYVIEINDTELLDYRFLYFQMIKSLKALKEGSVGANTRFLKIGMIRDLAISVPPIEKQRSIVFALDNLNNTSDALRIAYHKKIVELDNLRQSLLQKAFAGELT